MDTHLLTLLASSLVSGDDHGSPAPHGCWNKYTPRTALSPASAVETLAGLLPISNALALAPFSDFTLDVFPLLSCTFS